MIKLYILFHPKDQGILNSIKVNYCIVFMKHILDLVNSEKAVEIFINEFDEIYLI